MKSIENSIETKYSNNKIDEDLLIYEGRFCIYTDKMIKCSGKIFYKITDPVSINFIAKIYKYEDLDREEIKKLYDGIKIEIPGYKMIEADIISLRSGEIFGYIEEINISSKDTVVDYLEFDITNMDKIPGKLVKFDELVYAGRIEFSVNEYIVVIDKNYNYTKDLHSELVSKNGSIITHSGRIYKKDRSKFKTKNIYSLMSKLATALSFCCGRYINIPNTFGYDNNVEVYRSWNKMLSNNYKFVFKWTTTISNYHNFEKYLSLMCKKLDDKYYYETILNVLDWYIESLNGINLSNNIISIQTALEMLSYVLLVETSYNISPKKFDKRPANQNIRMLLSKCNIDSSILNFIDITSDITGTYRDGVDLITFCRNSIVHPSKSNKSVQISFEEMWDIILIGINYIELIILYLINYKGEYTNRFTDYSFGDVQTVPWSQKKINEKSIDKS